MANFNKGILGAFSGKVGNVVGASWRSLNILRSLPRKSNKQATVGQISQRQKFGLITSFIMLGKVVVEQYFGNRHAYKSRLNLCVSYHLKEAVLGTVDNFMIDYTKVIWTKGELLGLNNVTITPAVGLLLNFTFAGMSGQSNALATDEVLLVLYCPSFGELPVYYNIAERDDGAASVMVSSIWLGEQVHAWIAVTDNQRKLVATSQYLGVVTIL